MAAFLQAGGNTVNSSCFLNTAVHLYINHTPGARQALSTHTFDPRIDNDVVSGRRKKRTAEKYPCEVTSEKRRQMYKEREDAKKKDEKEKQAKKEERNKKRKLNEELKMKRMQERNDRQKKTPKKNSKECRQR